MSRGELFTSDEVVLCTYAAMYDARDFGGVPVIHRLRGRSVDSIKMKIQNIAAMLDEEGIARSSDYPPLTGRPPGQGGRRTNWEWVKPLTRLPRSEFRMKCAAIVDTLRKR